MGILFDYNKNFNIFNEVEIDGQEIGSQDATTDYNVEDKVAGQGNEEIQQSQQQPANDNDYPPPEEGYNADEPTDYNAADNSEESRGYDYQENGDGAGSPPPEEEQIVDALKSKEEEMYSNLTPEQLDIKHRELKNRYLEMFDMTNDIIDKIGNAAIDEESIGVVEYVSNTLTQLRTMLTDYIDSIYPTKSYIENSVNYNRFLAVLHGVNKMLEELPKKED